MPGTNASGVGAGVNGFSEYAGYPGIGYHFGARLEAGGGSGTVTWYGAVTFGGVSSQYNAIDGVILG